MGATAVLEMAAEIPPAKKSLAKETAVSFMFAVDSIIFVSKKPCRSVAGLEWYAGVGEMGRTVDLRTDLRLMCARDQTRASKPSYHWCANAFSGRGSVVCMKALA